MASAPIPFFESWFNTWIDFDYRGFVVKDVVIQNKSRIQFGSRVYNVLFDLDPSFPRNLTILNGTRQDDYLISTNFNQSINAGAGDDLIDIYGGKDIFVDGGRGNDTVRLTDSYRLSDLSFGRDKIGQFTITLLNQSILPTTHLKNVEYFQYYEERLRIIAGTENSDLLSGSAREKNLIVGLGGDDSIIGGQNKDYIFSGDGRDTIRAGAGDDRILGRKGDDSILAGNGNDIILAGDGSDFIDAGKGDDWIWTNLNPEEDNTASSLFSDTVKAGDGSDTIISFCGIQHLWGGSDNDVFLLYDVGLAHTVTIYDFDMDRDKIFANRNYRDLAEFKSHLTQIGSDTIFFDAKISVTIKNVNKEDFRDWNIARG